jgi:hypothetical protein
MLVEQALGVEGAVKLTNSFVVADLPRLKKLSSLDLHPG